MLAFALLATALLWAENLSSGIQGHVFDIRGAVAPNGTVTVINTRTGFLRTVKTDVGGVYHTDGLPRGRYEINAVLPGFERQSDVTWVGQNMLLTHDFVLNVAPTHGYGDVIISGYKPGAPYTFGVIRGTVVGGSLVTVQDAEVAARNFATGRVYNGKTDRHGRFTLPNLGGGSYEVRVQARGYRSEYRSAEIAYAEDARLEFQLESE